MQGIDKCAVVIYLDKSTKAALRKLVIHGRYPELLQAIQGFIHELAAKP